MTKTDRTAAYPNARAASQAIKAAAQHAKRQGSLPIDSLIRQVTFDRFLCRIFLPETTSFVLKGGTGMLARIPNARTTLDVDLTATTRALDDAVNELITLAQADLGDHFRFEFRSRRTQMQGENQPYTNGSHLTFNVFLGTTARGQLKIDLAAGYAPTGTITRRSPANRLTQLRFETRDYLLYPVVDQISDKICATMQPIGPQQEPSNREKDLVDLALLATTEHIDATELRHALATETRRRRMAPITSFTTPNQWGPVYRTLAQTTPLAHTLPTSADAAALITALINPILTGEITTGTWDHLRAAWTKRMAP